MEEKKSAVLTLYNQLRTLRSDVEKLRPQDVMSVPGLHGSGITTYIPHFNYLLERMRQLFSSDSHDFQVLEEIATVKSVEQIQESFSFVVHRDAKHRILNGSGIMLAVLDAYRQTTVPESTPVTQTREFTFVTDYELRKILERDYIEIQKAFVAQCWKSVILLSGSAIEAILMDLLMKNETAALGATNATKRKSCINRWTLEDIIKVSVELGLVSGGIDKLSHSVREYRNLIHPGNEIRTKLTFNKEEARIALEILNMVHRDSSQYL